MAIEIFTPSQMNKCQFYLNWHKNNNGFLIPNIFLSIIGKYRQLILIDTSTLYQFNMMINALLNTENDWQHYQTNKSDVLKNTSHIYHFHNNIKGKGNERLFAIKQKDIWFHIGTTNTSRESTEFRPNIWLQKAKELYPEIMQQYKIRGMPPSFKQADILSEQYVDDWRIYSRIGQLPCIRLDDGWYLYPNETNLNTYDKEGISVFGANSVFASAIDLSPNALMKQNK